MKGFLMTIFLVLIVTEIFGCNCSPPERISEAQIHEYQSSELIFIGEIVSLNADKKEFQIKIEEVFKGAINQKQILVGNNNIYCEPYIDFTGNWLIYGKFKDGKLVLNICGLSRSLEKPYENRYFIFIPVPPPPSATKEDLKEIEKKNKDGLDQMKPQAFIELNKEIELLRSKIN